MTETFRKTFDSARHVSQRGKAWKLTADGEPDEFVPMSCSQLERGDGGEVIAVVVSRSIAEEKGWITTDDYIQEESHEAPDAMSRRDWYTLGITMALLASGEQLGDAVWRASAEAARKLLEDPCER